MCAVTAFVGLTASVLLVMIFRLTSLSGVVTQLLMWALLLMTLGLAVVYTKKAWHKEYYEVTDDAVIVHLNSAFKANTSQTIYRYDSIVSIRLTQGVMGRQYGYGNIYLTIPKIDNEVVLKDIKQPVKQLSDIREHMQKPTSLKTTSLIT